MVVDQEVCAFVFECGVKPYESTSFSHFSARLQLADRRPPFSLLIRVEVAREQSVPPCHSSESVYSRDCCHSQQGRLGFQEKTSNWEGDPPGELTVPQTDTGEQVEYTRALERTMSKELGKMTP